MLIQFAVTNYKCFKDEAVLNLFPANRLRNNREHLLTDSDGKSINALPVAAIYGANASGKSSLARAIKFAQKLILKGTKADQVIDVPVYKLGKSDQEGARFEFVFKFKGQLITYGFIVTDTQIKEEWLFSDCGKGEKRLFERINKDSMVSVEFGEDFVTQSNDAQFLSYVAKGTRQNQLFLTEANERNVDGVKPTMEWVRSHLVVVFPHSLNLNIALRVQKDEEFGKYLGELLSGADTGISSIICHKEKLDYNKHVPGFPRERLEEIFESLRKDSSVGFTLTASGGNMFSIRLNPDTKEPEIITMNAAHKTEDGESVEFQASEESDGTRRIMHLASAMLDVRRNETTYIIDELDRSLHPKLSRYLLEIFLQGAAEKKSRGQLIFTTHETSLLDRDFLRPDEIWFIEKDKTGGSHLSSLVEFKLHHTLKIQKGYLNGRFGGIPVVGDVRKLIK